MSLRGTKQSRPLQVGLAYGDCFVPRNDKYEIKKRNSEIEHPKSEINTP
jgi:hypothetical protein